MLTPKELREKELRETEQLRQDNAFQTGERVKKRTVSSLESAIRHNDVTSRGGTVLVNLQDPSEAPLAIQEFNNHGWDAKYDPEMKDDYSIKSNAHYTERYDYFRLTPKE